jgi:FkbH-like protein
VPLPSLSDILADLNSRDRSGFAPLEMRVLRNITIEPIEPYWKYLGSQIRRDVHVRFANYDQILQTAAEDAQGLLSDAEIILVFSKLETLSPKLADSPEKLTPADRAREIEQITDYIQLCFKAIRQRSPALVLWHGFESAEISTSARPDAINVLNEALRSIAARQESCHIIDLEPVLRSLGVAGYYDARYWQLSKAPYSRAALAAIASEDFKLITALKGKAKKCLALDCDNVLWGGVVGEDGLEGIQLGPTPPGSYYQDFQKDLIELQRRGILLALCSKNNPENVREVFQKHPGMLLKEEHVLASQVNWDDKATNLRRLAEQLHIGLDSIVLADDSEFEAGLVRQIVPEVDVLSLPAGQPELFRRRLTESGWFNALQVTQEDRQRTAMMTSDRHRSELRTQFTDITSYLRSLEMVLTIRLLDESILPRVAQLSQKTNQFNLTTQRYTEDQMRRWIRNPEYEVLALSVVDRFGESGIVGVAVLHYQAQSATLENFFLSCRILGRRIEEAFLDVCLERAKQRGVRKINGVYRASAKNEQVKDFYEKQGFARIAMSGQFERDLSSFAPRVPDFLKELRKPLEMNNHANPHV